MKKMLSKRMTALALSLTLVIGCLCNNSTAVEAKGDKTIKKLTVTNVSGKKLLIRKGRKFKLRTKLQVTRGSKASRGLVYKSNKKSVATVNKKGAIKARKNGKAKIIVSSKANPSKKVVLKITVSQKVPKVKKIRLNKSKLTLYLGDEDYEDEEDEDYDDSDSDVEDSDEDYDDEDEDYDEYYDEDELGDDAYELIAKITPKTAMAADLVWSSSDEDVVEVDDEGYVLAMDEGTATITVRAKDGSNKKATCKVTVIDREADYDDEDEDYDVEDEE